MRPAVQSGDTTKEVTVKSLSIRGVDKALEQALKRAAQEQGTSVNQGVLEVLKARLGLTKAPHYSRRHHDLYELFGAREESDYRRVQGAVDEQRRVDPELWGAP
jgi:hypothetical protein